MLSQYHKPLWIMQTCIQSDGSIAMKRPFVTEEKTRWIASRYPTPFYLYNEAGIRANDARIKQTFSWNPGYPEHHEGPRQRPRLFFLYRT